MDTQRWAARRRDFDALERRVVRLQLQQNDEDVTPVVQALRYVLSFARLTVVRNADGEDIDVGGLNELHAMAVKEELTKAGSVYHEVVARCQRFGRWVWNSSSA